MGKKAQHFLPCVGRCKFFGAFALTIIAVTPVQSQIALTKAGASAAPAAARDELPDDRREDPGTAAEQLVDDASWFYGFSTINGREASSAANLRVADFKQLPVASAREEWSYRFPRADEIEGALFGTLETRTVRPLSLQRRHIDVELRAIDYPYGDRAHQGLGRRVNASYIDRYETGLGRIGISLGVLSRRVPQPREYYQTEVNTVPCNSSDLGVASGGAASGGKCRFDPQSNNPVYFVGPTSVYRQERVTEDLSGYFASVQWQPSDRLEFTLDAEHSRRITSRYRNELGLTDTEAGIVPIDVGSQGQLLRWSGQSALSLNAFQRRRDERYTGGGLTTRYRLGNQATLSADISYSRSLRLQDDTSATLQSNSAVGPGGVVTYTADQRAGGIPILNFTTPINLNDYTNFTENPTARRGHEFHRDSIWAGRLDGVVETDGFFQTIKMGVRVSDHHRTAQLHTYRAAAKDLDPANVAAGRAACRIPTIIDDFATQTSSNVRSWAMYDPICLFEAYAGTKADQATLAGLSGGGIEAREQILAGYVMGTFAASPDHLNIKGNIGVRVVQTRTTTHVYRFTSDPADLFGVRGQVGPLLDWLPSASLSLKPAHGLKIEAGVARVLSRSNIEGLGLRGILQATGPAATDTARPRPLRSWNADLAIHYKAATDTALFVDLTYKILQGSAWPADVLIPGGPQLLPEQIALSRRGSYIRGVEIGFDQRFSSLPAPLDGLRLRASYTFTDSNFRFPDPTAYNASLPLYLFVAAAGLPDISRHLAVASLQYEKHGIEMGIRYVYRSGYFRPEQFTPNRYLTPSNLLEVDAGIDLTHHVDLIFLASNLTNQAETYLRPSANVSQSAYAGRTFSFGVRLHD